MKYPCFLVLFYVLFVNCSSRTFIYSKDIFSFKYPTPLKVKIYDRPEDKTAVEVTWDPVKDWDKDDPIIGYKVVLWEMKKEKHIVHKFVDGEMKVEEVDTSHPRVPVGDPMIFIVTPNNRNVTVEDIKKDTWYEYSGLAFTQMNQGPLSPISGFNVAPVETT